MGALRGLIITKKGVSREKLSQAGWILSFYPLKDTQTRTVVVSKAGLEFKNFPSYRIPDRLTLYRLLFEIEERTMRYSRANAEFLTIFSLEYVLGLAKIQKLYFQTFCGLLWSLASEEFLAPSPNTEVSLNGESFFLWELLFLPVLGSIFVKETEELLHYNLEPKKEPKECIFSALSYIVGSRTFAFHLSAWIGLLRNLFILKPYRTKTHGGLPAHPRKFTKAGKGI